ncbi:MAG TPA: diguanylate cyclase [Clostridiales bacterium]|nr:diguanylate cyclase [Clostridiales bacterium]
MEMIEELRHGGVILIWNMQGDIIYANTQNEDIYIEILENMGIAVGMKEFHKCVMEWNGYNAFIDVMEIKGDIYVLANIIYRDSGMKRYKYLAYTDCLTNLYNRNFWEHMKSGEIEVSDYESYIIILLDVDNLKDVNDEIGHRGGDFALQRVAQAIRSSIRQTDIAIRYGGDEFLIIISDPKDDISPDAIIDRIRAKVAKINIDEDMHMSISAGYARGRGWKTLEETANLADFEMFKEKRAKKEFLSSMGREELNYIRTHIEYMRESLNKQIEICQEEKIDLEFLLKMSGELDEMINIYIDIVEGSNK